MYRLRISLMDHEKLDIELNVNFFQIKTEL